MGEEKEPRWLPLESNPDVMNSFLSELGMDSGYVITDVWGTDPDLLMMVPQPVLGLILLFPISKDESQPTPKIASATDSTEGSENVYYMKQFIGNACGTIALIHLVANRPELSFKEGSILSSFLANTRQLSPEERGKALACDTKFCDAHGKIAQAGQSAVPTEEESANLDLHFVAIVPHEGKIWELDGRKTGPVCHGPVTDENFLVDGVKVCKAFMEANPNENRFTIVALLIPANNVPLLSVYPAMNKQCTRCSKTVYPPEELSCLDKIWHKACFKCWDCGMALNMKTYKGFGKFPYCESHVPKPKATTMTGTPEMQRLAENTKIQSNVKYHADFEKSKGKYTTVADDPETIRIKEASRIISNVSYHGDLLKKAEMESRRALTKDDVGSDPHPVASKSSKGQGATFGQPSARSVLVTGASAGGYRQREQGQPSAAEQNKAEKQFLTPQQQRYEPPSAGQGLAKGTSSAKPPANLGRCYRAIYDYLAADMDEVAFKDGDLIINCSPIDEGWMTGTVQRTMRTGMLPANYVEPAN